MNIMSLELVSYVRPAFSSEVFYICQFLREHLLQVEQLFKAILQDCYI